MSDSAATALIDIEVVYATPQRQFLRALSIAAGSTVTDAIAASRLESDASIDMALVSVGIWSKSVQTNTVLRDGDRVEIYRSLIADPKETRRRRAGDRARLRKGP